MTWDGEVLSSCVVAMSLCVHDCCGVIECCCNVLVCDLLESRRQANVLLFGSHVTTWMHCQIREWEGVWCQLTCADREGDCTGW